MGSFEALRFIEAEEKRKNKAEKGKRREELEKRKSNLQPQFVGCKIGAFFTIKLGKIAKNGVYLPMKWGVGHIYIYIYMWVGFWQNGFLADFNFWAAGFCRGFCRRIFSPHFCGKKCPEKSSRKIPDKILQILYNTNPRQFSAEGPGQEISVPCAPWKIATPKQGDFPAEEKTENKKIKEKRAGE